MSLFSNNTAYDVTPLAVTAFLLLSLIALLMVKIFQYTTKRLSLRHNKDATEQSVKMIEKIQWAPSQDPPAVNAEYLRKRPKPVRRARSVLSPIKVVDYDPKNEDHQMALIMMINCGRAHPTLRFAFDSAAYDSMLQACVFRQAEASIEKRVRQRAEGLSRRLDKKAFETAYPSLSKVIKTAKKSPRKKTVGRSSGTKTKIKTKTGSELGSSDPQGKNVLTLSKGHAVK